MRFLISMYSTCAWKFLFTDRSDKSVLVRDILNIYVRTVFPLSSYIDVENSSICVITHALFPSFEFFFVISRCVYMLKKICYYNANYIAVSVFEFARGERQNGRFAQRVPLSPKNELAHFRIEICRFHLLSYAMNDKIKRLITYQLLDKAMCPVLVQNSWIINGLREERSDTFRRFGPSNLSLSQFAASIKLHAKSFFEKISHSVPKQYKIARNWIYSGIDIFILIEIYLNVYHFRVRVTSGLNFIKK